MVDFCAFVPALPSFSWRPKALSLSRLRAEGAVLIGDVYRFLHGASLRIPYLNLVNARRSWVVEGAKWCASSAKRTRMDSRKG